MDFYLPSVKYEHGSDMDSRYLSIADLSGIPALFLCHHSLHPSLNTVPVCPGPLPLAMCLRVSLSNTYMAPPMTTGDALVVNTTERTVQVRYIFLSIYRMSRHLPLLHRQTMDITIDATPFFERPCPSPVYVAAHASVSPTTSPKAFGQSRQRKRATSNGTRVRSSRRGRWGYKGSRR
ncbi:hypothetical protein M9X92_011562 [Pyricularia oryzae]|nr:hypothetical protein M9X92_011562 [Pyricularia oryzae]